MNKIEIYDPPMCCPTGVCGPNIDPKLVHFAADLEWLKGKGIKVERYNLAQQPDKFADFEAVKRLQGDSGRGVAERLQQIE